MVNMKAALLLAGLVSISSSAIACEAGADKNIALEISDTITGEKTTHNFFLGCQRVYSESKFEVTPYMLDADTVEQARDGYELSVYLDDQENYSITYSAEKVLGWNDFKFGKVSGRLPNVKKASTRHNFKVGDGITVQFNSENFIFTVQSNAPSALANNTKGSLELN